MNKLTKIVLSFLMVITCINFSTVQAEDGEEVNYSEPTTVETVSEDPANEVEQEVAQEEPAVEEEATVEEAPAEQPAEEAAPVEEPQQEEVAPEASEEAQVEEVNNAPEEAASEETTVAAEPQQEETTATPEEPQEEATEEPAEVQKATVEISYVDEEDKEIADKVSDKEFDVDFVVTADDKEVYKDIDGYTFKEAIVNDDAENRTFTADTIKLDGLKVTSDMNKVKLVYSKNPVTTKKDTTVKKTSKKSSGLLGALEKAVDTLTEKTEEASDDADPLSVASTAVTVNVNRTTKLTGKGSWYSDHTWSTDNNDVVKITEENGREATIKGINPGTATVTHTYGNGYVDTWTVTVPTVGTVNASVFFLNDPNEDAGSNGTGMWYPSDGESNLTAVLDLTNAKFNGEKNLFNVDSYVVSWPDRSTGPSWVLPTTNEYWDRTFEAYKSKVERELGVSISKDDVTKIVLHPHKISDNASGYHLDCNVEVVCRKVITVAFKVKDVNSDIFVNVSSTNYKTDVNGNVSIPMFSQPATKIVDGKTYTFQGWYTDEKCTNLVTEWPTTTKENVNYYGKYVCEYTVNYVANGGTFAEETTISSTHLEGSQFTLAAAPTRTGYTFQGWKLDNTNYAAGTTYTMPARDITFEAQWVSSAFTVGELSDVVYNGQSQKLDPVVKDANDGTILKKDKDYTVSYSEDTTNVGEVTVTIEGAGSYTGTVTRTYKIKPATLTVTTPDKAKAYDGSALTAEGTVTGFVNKETATFTTTGSQTEAGHSPNTYSLTWNGTAKESNYTVSETVGTLTVTEQSITPDPEKPESYKGVTVNNPTDVVYSGVEQKWTPEVKDSTGNALKAGTDYTVSYSEDTTNVGEVKVTIEGAGSYTGTVTRTYKIKPRSICFTSGTASKPYDGTPLTNENVSVSGDGFAEGEGATFAVIGTITNVGTKANTFGYALNKNTLASNYNISTELGTLTITPKTITPDDKKTGITVENPGDVKYDGKDHAEKPVIKDEKTGVTLEEGKDYEIVYPEDIKNAGEITATVVGKGDYEGSFEIKFNILKRDVTFTSATDSKQYDGNALTNGNVEITGDGFIEGEGATFNVTGSITDVGSTNNAFTYAMNEGTNADNYNVTVVEGTLTVSEQPVVPTPATPTTPSNNTPARTNNVPARVVTNPTTTTPAPEATVEPEKAETTPAPTAKPEKIKEEATPQAAPKGHWALINLIASMLSVVLAVVALLAKHAKDEDEDDEDKDDQVVANENEDDENESTRHRRWKVIATIDAILAVVVFILTENISLPMVLVDKWTVLMVLFGLISIVSTYFARKWHEEDEDEDEESSQNA